MKLEKEIIASLNLGRYLKNNVWASAIIGGKPFFAGGNSRSLFSPIDHSELGEFVPSDNELTREAIEEAHSAFLKWRTIPAPRRGELVRLIGSAVRAHKKELAHLITLEAGKIVAEAEGEVQEWIDICDFAVGLSRQLYGLTIVSERVEHRMMEQWHPLGVVGVITAFNFPQAVWAWNAMLALVCGDAVVWKPSEKTPLCALAVQSIVDDVVSRFDGAPSGLSNVVQGLADTGKQLAESPRIPLLSATGSVRMGKLVAPVVASRLGRILLELGGNNAMIITETAKLELAIRAIVFAATGTAGQRCTSLRRLIVQESIIDQVIPRLIKAYSSLPVGDPRKPNVLVGPLIDEAAFVSQEQALKKAKAQKAEILHGGEWITEGVPANGYYVRPALIRVSGNLEVVCQETFAPILYIMTYRTLDEAIDLQNEVTQGLSSAIFTDRVREAERFLSVTGSDCGIANVNIGTSGAEIGGAFGGEKQTGGGRESGSDSWKNYMRRATNTINYGNALPLAQGIQFDV